MKTSLIKSKPLLFYGSLLLLTLPLFSYQTFKPSYTGAEDLREEVPIVINYDKKIITPVIDFRINNKSYNAVFDTGSSGIRIIGGALKGQVSETGNERVNLAAKASIEAGSSRSMNSISTPSIPSSARRALWRSRVGACQL